MSRDISFIGRLVQKIVILCFQILLFRKQLNNQISAEMIQVIPSFFANHSENSLFISANTYEKYILCKGFCMADHNGKVCFLPNCRYHIILIGNIDGLLQKMGAFCFTYLCTFCIPYSSVESAEKLLPRVDKCLIMCKELSSLL